MEHSELSYALRALFVAHEKATRATAHQLDLNLTDLTAVDHLLSSPHGLGPTELGRLLGIRASAATKVVDRLTASGHAQRDEHGSDRRRQTVQATPKAYQDVIDALLPLFARVEAAAGRLTPEQATATAWFLREVTEAMNSFAAE
ncbi:MAG: MarR family transcriptional regulator [Actinoplanes sp.]